MKRYIVTYRCPKKPSISAGCNDVTGCREKRTAGTALGPRGRQPTGQRKPDVGAYL